MKDLSNRIAVITGAGKGIGKAIAKRFLQENVAGIALFDLDYDLVKETVKELDPEGTRAIAVRCDVSSEEEVNNAFHLVEERFGRVDLLVNNAGITRDAMFHKMTPEMAKKVMDVHYFGTFYCCKAAILGMRERNYGKIVNISSTSTFGNVGQTNYSAAKCAIEGFTRTLAMESGRKNITVNCISPGMVDTDILKTIPEETLKMRIQNSPCQRLGSTDEIASVAAFLCSDDSAWVTGNTVLVCGGARMRA